MVNHNVPTAPSPSRNPGRARRPWAVLLGAGCVAAALAVAPGGHTAAVHPQDKGGDKKPKQETPVKGVKLAGSIYGRKGEMREQLLRAGGGTKESEEAVARGLKWLAKQQQADGKWVLTGDYPDQGSVSDGTPGVALALLPFFGSGYTHLKPKKGEDNPYAAGLARGLGYLISKQDKKTGYLGSSNYAHGLGTIALCEAYGLSQDAALKGPAQAAVNYIVTGQHDGGGWRYGPKQAGDTSVTGWQVMALQTARMAGLAVPKETFAKAQKFLDGVCDRATEGYGYTEPKATPTNTAIGLLCRQYLQGWGPDEPRLKKGVENVLDKFPPEKSKNLYYVYYATQMLHHVGGDRWERWNEKVRDYLVKSQELGEGKLKGSWTAKGDAYGHNGGRLMTTSLALLTLQVYYRHVPLCYVAEEKN